MRAGWFGSRPGSRASVIRTGDRHQAFRCASRSGADRQVGVQGNLTSVGRPPTGQYKDPRREPLHGLARRAFRCAPRSGADRRSAFPDLCAALPTGVRAETNHSTGWRGAPFAPLRAAVPTGGRRSLTCAPPCPREYGPRREPLHGLARRAFRCAPRSGADRRRSLPCAPRETGRDGNHCGGDALRAAVPTGGRRSRRPAPARERRPLAGTGPRLRRWEPLHGLARRAFRSADRRSAFPALRAALPTGVRAETGTTPRAGEARLSPRSAGRCRPEVGGPCPARRPAHRSTGWCQSQPHATMQSDAQARERRPLVGTGRRRRPADKDPDCGDGSPLNRDPGAQRHPDGRVVHASRPAPPAPARYRERFFLYSRVRRTGVPAKP